MLPEVAALISELREAFANPLLLDPNAAAALLGVSRSQIYRMRAENRLPPPVKVPGRSTPMFRRADLEAFIKRLPTFRGRASS